MGDFTKGEWKREGNKIKVLGSGTVAICPSPTTDEGVLEFQANAQLIASAPDMYEALDFISPVELAKLNPSTQEYIRQALDKAKH